MNMRLNNFSVRVSPGREKEGYVALRHGQEYRITLRNDNDTKCDAHVCVDGKEIGIFRVHPHASATIERPADVSRRLTFFKSGTQEAEKANLDAVKDDDLGLIQVKFIPEKRREVYRTSGAGGQSVNTSNSPLRSLWLSGYNGNRESDPRLATKGMSAGGTGLGQQSSQQFTTASPIKEIDEARVTTISLRLVCDDSEDEISELKPMQTSTPVPPPIYRT